MLKNYRLKIQFGSKKEKLDHLKKMRARTIRGIFFLGTTDRCTEVSFSSGSKSGLKNKSLKRRKKWKANASSLDFSQKMAKWFKKTCVLATQDAIFSPLQQKDAQMPFFLCLEFQLKTSLWSKGKSEKQTFEILF